MLFALVGEALEPRPAIAAPLGHGVVLAVALVAGADARAHADRDFFEDRSDGFGESQEGRAVGVVYFSQGRSDAFGDFSDGRSDA